VRKALAPAIAERQTRRVNQPATADDQLWVNGRTLLRRPLDLAPLSYVGRGEAILAARVDRAIGSKLLPDVLLDPAKLRAALADCEAADCPDEDALLIENPWQLVHANAAEIVRQGNGREFNRAGRIDPGAQLVGDHPIHVGDGAVVKAGAVLDAEEGPIWIGEKSTIGPHAVLTGPCYIGDRCVIRPGAALARCSIGDACKIGGELEATIFHGYSNKQHDGFLGHSYFGEWVNLGADTIGSDLKNTYGAVSVPINGVGIDSGEMFVGAFIGDHTKTAIGTRLPTGCVIGYACNVAVSGFAPQFVPSFTWLTDGGEQRNDPARALAVAHRVVERRGRSLSKIEAALFMSIAEEAKSWEYTPSEPRP
jgi:UDP-N-acetylglucosamine diphosphorylase/glucosamine-1-phosphate N-acetyltransferase